MSIDYEVDIQMTCGATVDCVLPSGGIGVAFPDGALSGFSPLLDSIDLASSPHRTNYERYFADLGTREEVIEAGDACIHDTWILCSTCVFEDWGEVFGCRDGGCGGFDEWLDAQAVI